MTYRVDEYPDPFIISDLPQRRSVDRALEAPEIASPSEIEKPDASKNVGRLEKLKEKVEVLKEKWNDPTIRKAVGTLAYVGAALLVAAAATALVLHFKFGEILGFKISITYPAMLASFAALAVLKGLQFREEAALLKKQQLTSAQTQLLLESNEMLELEAQVEVLRESPDKAEIDKLLGSFREMVDPTKNSVEAALKNLEAANAMRPLIDSKPELLWKGIALVAGIALIALFAYQMYGLFNSGATSLRMGAVTLVSAIGVLSYALALVSRFFYNQRRELANKETTLASGGKYAVREKYNSFIEELEAIAARHAQAEASLEKRLEGASVDMNRKVALIAPDAPENIVARGKLKKGLVRLVPNKLGKIAMVAGGVIVLTALAGIIAHYGFDAKAISMAHSYTPLTLANMTKLALAGVFIIVTGGVQVFAYRNEKEIAEKDEKVEDLKANVDKLKKTLASYPETKIEDEKLLALQERITTLEANRLRRIKLQERSEIARKAIGAVVITAGLALLAMQLWGFDPASFRQIFGITIPTNLISTAIVLSYAIGIVYGGIALINNGMEHSQDVEGATLENEKRSLELKIQLRMLNHKKLA